MIPAILTCVFVVYLYRKLHPPTEKPAQASNPNEAASPADLSESSRRVERLTARLRKLQSNTNPGAKR